MGTCRALVLLFLLSAHVAVMESFSLALELSRFPPILADRVVSRFRSAGGCAAADCPGCIARRAYRVY